MKKSANSLIPIGLMLFALFFGAGNLIFPVFMGQNSGVNTIPATIGFLITGVGLPILGVAAIGYSGSDLEALASRIHPKYAIFFTVALYLTIGPAFAIPRTATTSFEIAVAPFFGSAMKSMALYVFCFLFFVVSWWLSVSPNKLVNRIGKVITPAHLREIMEDLVSQGAHCIDLVTPTHFTPWVLEALDQPLPVPVVWNSGGYERVETLRTLEGKVQIYLPDLKYAMERPARELSAAPDYFEAAAAAIDEMVRQVGAYQIGDDGLMRSGVILRHLVLPGQMENTKRVIDYVSTHFPPKTVLFSLMSQYTPQPGSTGALARRLNEREYRTAVQYMRDCGLTDGFCQELSSAKEEYTPVFDLQGV